MNQEIYNTLKLQTPSRLISPNSHAAAYTWDEWLKTNNCRELKDADGHLWHVQLHQKKLPGPANSDSIWKVSLQLVSHATAHELTATRVLDSVTDARLISMCGDEEVTFSMKPTTHASSRIEDARSWLHEQMTVARRRLMNPEIRQIKRALTTRWLSERRIFGSPK